jgi:hypothetical protein
LVTVLDEKPNSFVVVWKLFACNEKIISFGFGTGMP